MRKFTLLLLSFFIAAPFIVTAQMHPLAFGADGGAYVNPNWYANYVGLRIDVISPATIAGEKMHTAANSGSSLSTDWGGIVTTPIVNIPIKMPQAGDSLAGSPILAGSMIGKVALVYRGGGIEYACKALAAQTAGAIACIIVNNIPGAPLGMSAGGTCSGITIPVFMISKTDGDALDVQYCSGTIPSVSITPWGEGYARDLGFVPQGIAGWSNFATPANQMYPGLGGFGSKGMSGAFIANYGTHKATNVKVKDTLTYTPTVGGSSVIHTGVSPTLPTFLVADSIYAMFGSAEYNFAPTGTGNGRFDLKYTIASDSVDQFPADNSATYSFYTTDSVYSKGTYDFTNNVPAVSNYIAPGGGFFSFLWGPMYYVARGGSCISSVQFSLSNNTGGPLGSSTGYLNVHIMKWVDGAGGPADSVAEIGEMTEVSTGVYPISITDTSGAMFKVPMGLPGSGTIAGVLLDSASWYYVAVEVPSGCFLGVDGQHSPYPRVYGRDFYANMFDYPGIEWNGDYSSFSTYTPGQALAPCPFPSTAYINTVDSFNYSAQKGMIPAVSLIVNNTPVSDVTGTTGICIGSFFTFHDPIAGGTWSSSTPSVATVDLTSGLVSGIAAGTAVITYHVSSSIATLTVTVAPIPAVGSISGPSAVCAGSAITLTDTFSGGTGTWSADTGSALSVSASGVVTGITPGTFASVYYTVSNACMTVYAGHFISVGDSIVTGTVSGPSAVCVGSSIGLSESVTTGTWSASNTHASVSGGTVTGVTAGTDVVSFTVTTSCGSGAATATITVNPLPAPSVTVSGITLSTSPSYTSYQWLLPSSGGAISGATNATYDALINGGYQVTVTDANGCTGTSGLGIVSTVGVKNINAAGNGVSVSPNPTSGAFSVQSASAGVFTLYSLEGKAITHYTVQAGVTSLSLPSALATGVYMGKFEGDNGSVITIRLVYEP